MYDCETCPRYFNSWYACRQHMSDTGHWGVRYECETCDDQFLTQWEVEEHMDDNGHHAPKIPCETCGRKFYNQTSADQHMNAMDHWAPTWPCETCTQMFHTEGAAEQHMRAKSHYKNYCHPCNRRFDTANNLKMHLNSKIHRGQDVLCPFCNAAFTTATGAAHHLETGSCKRAVGLNRETIYKFVRSRDTQGVITRKLLEWNEDDNIQYKANSRAYNGDYWECYLCHREFNTLTALNQHLNSPVHKQKLYHCPNAKCRKQFITIAALFNHLESESCAYMRFEKVQRQVQDVFRGGRAIAF
ncbi:C2H2-type zinc finger protein [Aspergillus luchuensis]|uniref:Zinc finger protein n=2 Tax=Aspergillus kawachii TaxID=1069201 RepID=A0A146FKZ6_ASPKA|nr:uncharacterized protein AKAW2_30340A [Aspergillus luchuensis]OJZ87620.1 hypothetical protein ASPFODRAFT_206451 [Aspergillus luchuensis CBS 106.47]GAA87418.1 zinc finger protein [Aspergillus luchuensis IFO 4308]BCR97021.1 hypothetical protein AKAW2_30340A [Aspergillus luchuensis]BCS09497.1 hypothetical protein ALUC_30314A [Aspergillus luchuensis]GAT26022.1 zinc finger protein [Aspergillus luchuensis]